MLQLRACGVWSSQPVGRLLGGHFRIILGLLLFVAVSRTQDSQLGTLDIEVHVLTENGSRLQPHPPVCVEATSKEEGTTRNCQELDAQDKTSLPLRNGNYRLTARPRPDNGAWIQNPNAQNYVYVPATTEVEATLDLSRRGRNANNSFGIGPPATRLLLVLYAQDRPSSQTPPATCPETTGKVTSLRLEMPIALEGARVTITADGEPAYDTVTDRNGEYVIPKERLKPDTTYILTVRKSGYYTSSLPANCTGIVPVIVMSEEITEGLPLVRLDEPARRYVFLPNLLEALPLDRIRSFDSFTLLAPGVLPAPAGYDARGPGIGPGIGTPGQYSINGARSRENSFQFDGSDNNDEEFGVRRQGFVSPAPEAVESVAEFQVFTALADARYGRNIGGQIDALTKRGGVAYHGVGYGFLSDQRLNARNFFNQSPPGPLPPAVMLDGSPLFPGPPPAGIDPFSRAQTGFNFSGPLAPGAPAAKGLFFLVAFERQSIRSSVTSLFNVPTLDQRGIQGSGRTGALNGALYPASLAGDALFSLFPFPNDPSGPYGANTYSARLPSDGTGYLGSLGSDYIMPRLRSAFTVRYNRTTEDSQLPSIEGALDSSLTPRFRTHNVATYFTTNVTSALANTFRFSFGLYFQFHAKFGKAPADPAFTPFKPSGSADTDPGCSSGSH